MSLVLWFKGSPSSSASAITGQQPIYTLDARQRPLSSGSARHLVSDSLRGRAKFVIPQQQAANATKQPPPLPNDSATLQVPYLDLSPLEAEDQGEYRCRVDYRSRPRENFLIVLFVLGK